MKNGKISGGITVAIIVLLFLQPIPTQADSNLGTGIEKDQVGISDINTISPPQIKIETSMDINVVFIGFDQSNIDQSNIEGFAYLNLLERCLLMVKKMLRLPVDLFIY